MPEGRSGIPPHSNPEDKKDLTDPLLEWVNKRIMALEKLNVQGFVFKCRSPSCGLNDVSLYDEYGQVADTVSGIFTTRFIEHFPHLPISNDEKLHDATLLEVFMEKILSKNA